MNKSFFYLRLNADGSKSVLKFSDVDFLQDFVEEFVEQVGDFGDRKHCLLVLSTGKNRDLENILSDDKFLSDVTAKTMDKLDVFWGVPSSATISMDARALYQTGNRLEGGKSIDVWRTFRTHLSNTLDSEERKKFDAIGETEMLVYFDIARTNESYVLESVFVVSLPKDCFPNNPITVRNKLIDLIEKSVEYQEYTDAEKFDEYEKIIKPAALGVFRMFW